MHGFFDLNEEEKFKVLLEMYWRDVANYIVTAWNLRQNNMYDTQL